MCLETVAGAYYLKGKVDIFGFIKIKESIIIEVSTNKVFRRLVTAIITCHIDTFCSQNFELIT